MSTTDNKMSQGGAGVLVDDHSEVDILIHDLLAALDESNKARSFEQLDLLWARLAVHIRAEHLHLFPSILGALDQPLDVPPADMPSSEHVREVLERLREDHDFFMVELSKAVNAARVWFLPGNEPTLDQFLEIKHCVLSVSHRLQEHNQMEEDHVYLWPEILIPPAECAGMSVRMKREIDNLPPRFSASNGG
jgi:hypothetical protein